MKFRAENKNGEYLNITELRVKDGKLKGSDTWFGTKENPCYAPSGVWYTNLEMFLHNKWQPVSELETPKRSPDSNGVLPLTDEELRELADILAIQFGEKTLKDKIVKVYLGQFLDTLNCEIQIANNLTYKRNITNYKAILWLAERFNLTGGE